MIRKATFSDIPGILSLIQPFVEQDIILGKTREDIVERIRDYFVYEEEGRIMGCCALYPGWDSLGEIRTTVVSPDRKGRGIGRKLVEACIKDARELGIPKLFVLTYEVEFFRKMGFEVVDMHSLPQKIFRDCIMCKHFPDCDETAMVMELEQA